MPFATFTGTFTRRVDVRPHHDPFTTFKAGLISRSSDLHADLHDLHAATTFTRTPLSRGVREGVGSFTKRRDEGQGRVRGGNARQCPKQRAAPEIKLSTFQTIPARTCSATRKDTSP